MAIVIGDRFAYNPALFEILRGSNHELYLPPIQFAEATKDFTLENLGEQLAQLDVVGPTINVTGVPDGSKMSLMALGECGPVAYKALFFIDQTPKADRIVFTCDLEDAEVAHLNTMEVSKEQLMEVIGACRDYVAQHDVSPIEKPVAQSKGPAKKSKPVTKAE